MLFIGVAGFQEPHWCWTGAIKSVKGQTLEQTILENLVAPNGAADAILRLLGERKFVCENAKSGTNAIQHFHSVEASNGDTRNLEQELPLSSYRIKIESPTRCENRVTHTPCVEKSTRSNWDTPFTRPPCESHASSG